MDNVAIPIIEDRDLKVSEWVLAFVNGIGGTPLIELYVVANELTKQMFPRKRGCYDGRSGTDTTRVSACSTQIL
jgi:dihydroxyacetone kinase